MLSLMLIPLTFIFRKLFELIYVPFVEFTQKVFVNKNKASNETKKRFDFFDLYETTDVRKLGLIASDREWEYECPSQTENQIMRIIGVNSMGQSLRVIIDWRPQTSNTSAIKVYFAYEDGKGNTYHMNEQNLMPFDKTKREYKAHGIAVEVLSPFRRLRIKFRGFLTKNNSNELVFVKIRLLWVAISNIFDFESDNNQEFLENELKKNSISKPVSDIKFENRYEQLGQMKGTVQIEDQTEENLFLWGTKSKKYEEPNQKRRITRLFGYSKKGRVFHICQVSDVHNKVSYRNGFMFWGRTSTNPIESLTNIDINELSLQKKPKFSVTAGDKTFDVSLTEVSTNDQIWSIKINDDDDGKAVMIVDDETQREPWNENLNNELYFPYAVTTDALVLPLSDRRAENVLTTGGKGSSLASMNFLKTKLNNSLTIDIPKGIVVTSNGYQLMLNKNKHIISCIDRMKSTISEVDSLKNESTNVVNAFKSSQLPNEIKDQIRYNLSLIYGPNEWQEKAFAVRSSASGEDSEEMSAAGQMTTYLGVKGLDAIYSAVVKCWSSQFEFVAIEYKRGYGQDLNSLMAVVIQEMVDCDAAGVLFTCDPLTGSEREVIITGNYGIGESVVSAMAEPDTIRVAIDVINNSFNGRKVKQISSVSIGSKAKSIKMDGSGGGTVEVERVETNQCCISDETAVKLTQIALEIQRFFGSVRDIEWGIKDGQIFILQSRPVTNLDSGYTEFEMMHEMDSGLPSEKEHLTKANVGEVLPGCSSTLSVNLNLRMFMPVFIRDMHEKEGLPLSAFCPHVPSDMMIIYNHLFLNLKNSEFLKLSGENEMSTYSKAMIYSLFGHELDKEILDDCSEMTPKEPWNRTFWKNFYLSPYLMYPQYFVEKMDKEIHQYRYILDRKFDSAKEMFDAMMAGIWEAIEYSCLVHIKASEASSMANHYLISILSQQKDNPHLFIDFAYLLSQCGQLVSADVPEELLRLAQTIKDPKQFKELSDDKALESLQNGNDKSSQLFKSFIARHGHRGYKEFDPITKVWRDDPIQVIKSLKTMLSGDTSQYLTNEKKSVDHIIASLQTPLSFHRKVLLRNAFLPLARRAVQMREWTKSCIIYSFDLVRRALNILSEKMRSEGIIPDNELIFHMTPEEIQEVIDTRNPIILWKAKQRQRLRKKMDSWKFDEIVSGYDFKPRELMENQFANISSDHVLKANPVSVGRIVARACVVPNLEDAVNIQPGDILITYSTDIGWSPYFPMISGIVTEIGGLISHGAVIAREYGLPCLVGANGACSIFKTGDMILVDCQKGFMCRVDNNNEQNGKIN